MKRCLGCMQQYEDDFQVCPHCGYVEDSVPEEAYHIMPGTVLQGRYVVGKVLGYGGFGVTYIGWDPKMERVIAIKEYLPTEFSTRMPEQTRLTVFSGEKEEQFSEGLRKFIEEAKRLAQIQSQLNFSNGVVHIYDCFEENGTAYIIMEHLEGETIADRLKREGIISPQETVELMLPVLYALDEIHENSKYVREDGVEEQIIHRDIAPDNIFITNDVDEEGHRIVKLIDFGAARYSTTRHSKSLSVLIKPGYSPEEQYRSRGDQGSWTDVYAVAATMYRMITGVVPQDAIERPTKDLVKKPSKMGVKIKKSVETAILNAMNIKIENRTQTIEEFVHELGAAEVKRKRELIKKTDVGNWPRWLKVTTGSVAAAVAVFVLLIATGIIKPGLEGYVLPELDVNQARIPNIINMDEEDAAREVENAEIKRDSSSREEDRLIMQILDKQYDVAIADGKVLAQSQLPGSVTDVTTEEGRTLGVIVSAGEEKTYVPDVLNMMQNVAESMIENADLIPQFVEAPGDDAPGSVSIQNPEADTELNVGTDVELTISTGRGFDSSKTSTVPDLVGKQYQDAKFQLLDMGLYLAKSETRVDTTIPAGQIIKQETEPGTTISQDSTILVVVSVGTPEVMVPDTQYKDVATARDLLESVGLTVKIVEEDNLIVQKDHVISQSVEAGTKVKAGTEITIYISKGNVLANANISAQDVVINRDTMDNIGRQTATNNTDAQSNGNNNRTGSASNNAGRPVINILSPKVTVPSVTGASASAAESSIRSAGLVPAFAFAFSDSVPDGNVISQSEPGGSEVEKNTPITIVVSKGRPAPSGWTTDDSFVGNPHYTSTTRTYYSYRTMNRQVETKTVTRQSEPSYSENGWTVVDVTKSRGDYGPWVESTETTPREDAIQGFVCGTFQKNVTNNVTQYRWVSYTIPGSSNFSYADQGAGGVFSEWNEDGSHIYLNGQVYGLNWQEDIDGHKCVWSSPGTGRAYFLESRNAPVTNSVTVNGIRYYPVMYTYVLQRYSDASWGEWTPFSETRQTLLNNNTTKMEERTETRYFYTAK